jgi:hypothetical protein
MEMKKRIKKIGVLAVLLLAGMIASKNEIKAQRKIIIVDGKVEKFSNFTVCYCNRGSGCKCAIATN